MSGPYDRSDDPDEVTLWAGRLRSWPTQPAAEDDEFADETVLSRRDTPDDDTIRSAVDVPEDATYVSRHVPVDEPAGSRVDLADEVTVVSRPEAPVGEPSGSRAELLDEATIVSRAEAPTDDTSQSRVEPPDDATVASRREALDDATLASPPKRHALPGQADPTDAEVGATAPRRATTRPLLDAVVLDETTRSRPAPEAEGAVPDELTRRRSSDPDPLDEATRARPAADVDDETASGPRRRRREATAARAEPVVEGAVRDVRVPAALARESYGPRREGPARVERVAPVRAPSAPDVGAVRPRANRGVGRVIVLVTVVAVVLVASIFGAVLLLTA